MLTLTNIHYHYFFVYLKIYLVNTYNHFYIHIIIKLFSIIWGDVTFFNWKIKVISKNGVYIDFTIETEELSKNPYFSFPSIRAVNWSARLKHERLVFSQVLDYTSILSSERPISSISHKPFDLPLRLNWIIWVNSPNQILPIWPNHLHLHRNHRIHQWLPKWCPAAGWFEQRNGGRGIGLCVHDLYWWSLVWSTCTWGLHTHKDAFVTEDGKYWENLVSSKGGTPRVLIKLKLSLKVCGT